MRKLLPLAIVAAAVAATPAFAKEGAEATLETPIPLDAAPGTQITVAWTLSYRDEDGKRHAFGAGGVFIRLVSASGGKATTAFASGDAGAYRATAIVPEGGIGGILIGLRGFVSGPQGSSTHDMYFPITNNPLHGIRVTSPRSGADATAGAAPWRSALAASVVTLAGAAAVLWQRRRLRGAL